MGISYIQLENFKSISAPVRINFKPITLLYGPNSCGKSTILQALMYAYEVLANNNCDADRVNFSDEINLGGFKNLVHNHDLSKTIRITIGSFDEGEEFPNYGFMGSEELDDFSYENELGIAAACGEFIIGAPQQEISFNISWNDELSKPMLSRVDVGVGLVDFKDKSSVERFASIIYDKKNNISKITNINYEHEIFNIDLPKEKNGAFKNLILELNNHDQLYKEAGVMDLISEDLDAVFFQADKGLRIATGSPASDKFYEALEKSNEYEDENDQRNPALDKIVDELRVKADVEKKIKNAINEFFSQAISGRAKILLSALEALIYIGPLRELPQRNFIPQKTYDKKRWSRGVAAWDLLATSDASFLGEVSNSIFNLGLGYFLHRKSFLTLDKDNQLFKEVSSLLNGPEHSIDCSIIQKLIDEMPEQMEVVLKSVTGIELKLQDVGTGISQVLPIVVACCLHEENKLISVEQPELHIHPALQLELADLLLTSFQDKLEEGRSYPITFEENDDARCRFKTTLSTLIETHSEHLLLRFLKRIRQTYNDELPNEIYRLFWKELAVYYVDNHQGISTVKELTISPDGEFEENWPKGFFEEREAELFH